MKAIEQYSAMVLSITLYKVVLAFKSVDKIVKCADLSNKSYGVFLFCGIVYYSV